MSGPKSSSYTLTARQRALLLEQQRLEQERLMERQRLQQERDRYEQFTATLQEQRAELDARMERLNTLVRESGRHTEEAEHIRAALTETDERLQNLRKRVSSTSAEMKALNGELQKLRTELSELQLTTGTLTESLGESYRGELDDIIRSGFSLSFAGIGDAKKDNVYLERINRLLAGVGPDLPAALRERFQRIREQAEAITDADYLENFCAVVVTPFADTCRACEGYEDALTRYRLLAQEAHVEPQSFDCSVEGIRKLREASDLLEKEILADRERAYINAALDAAMQEMGYRLVGNRIQVKKTGKHVRHELYSLRDGTAVDVTYADSGQISMELGGIGTSDRAPTAEESERLTEDMRSFCRDYAELERKLAERGVLTAAISRLPPSAEYAQIFNTNDYELTGTVETPRTERKRTGSASVMYRE